MEISHYKFVVKCIKVKNKRDKYNIYSDYNKEFIENIKLLPKNQREYKNKYWELNTRGLYQLIKFFKGSDKIIFDFENNEERKVFIEKIKKIDVEDDQKKLKVKELEKNKKIWLKLKDEYEKNYKKYWEDVHKNLKPNIKLYPHQVVAALFLDKVKNALLALEMGTGKSLASIAYIEMNDFEKVIVITPNSLKFNYYEEVKKFTNSKAHIVNWKNNIYEIEESKYIIMNYEYYNSSDKKKMDEKFKNLNIGKIDSVICDESTRLKNSASNTFKNFKRIFNNKIFKQKPSKIFLSGTPAPNRAFELYTVLNQISPIDFATKNYFYEYYCGMTYDIDGYGWETDIGSQKLEELFHKISPFIYRKRKKDVLQDLPDKIYQKILLEMTDKEEKEYENIEQDTLDSIFQTENHPLTIMIRLRQYVSNIKIFRIKEIIDSILETGEKIVIVDMFKPILYEIQKLYPDISVVHTGDQTIEERADMVKEFQNPESNVKIFLGSIQTCNYGLTLTAASTLIILTLPFSVGEYDQVTDRCILKGELVLTKNGYIKIEDIKIDDLVYTHKGNWKKVLGTSNKIERKKIYCDINYKGFYKPLRCTSDHKIYVYNNKNKIYEWVEAGELNIMNHFMVFSKSNIDNYNNSFIIEEYKSNAYNKININKNVNIEDEDLLYALGRFVGDGHINDHQISICGHINEYDNVLFCIETIKNVFNIKKHTEYKRDNKIEMYISSIELRNNFKVWFNEGAKNKKIPEYIYHLDNKYIRSFLNGYYSADGYRRKNTQQASTVSKYLSYQLIELEGLLGNKPTLRYNEYSNCWSFEFSLNDKIKRTTLIKNVNGNILYPISSIKKYKPKRNDEKVYDLKIEDDNSFVVGLSTVHNCHRIGQKNTVNIYLPIFKNTIDEYVFFSLEDKMKEILKVIDNESYTSNVSESVFNDVINNLKKKYS